MKKITLRKNGSQLLAPVNELTIPEWYQEKLNGEKSDFITRSLHVEGFLQPITINMFDSRQGIIINGVQTLRACIELKRLEIPVFPVYIEPDREQECHVLLNERKGILSDQQKRELMRERFDSFFGENNDLLNDEASAYDILEDDDESDLDLADLMQNAQLKSEELKQNRKGIVRRCVFNLQPEYSDYPEKAMKAYGFKSKSELFIQLLKWCVEDEVNEAA